jgi:hypothetical protein
MEVRLEAEAGRSCKGAALYRLQQDKQLPTVLCLNARISNFTKKTNFSDRNEVMIRYVDQDTQVKSLCQLVVFRALFKVLCDLPTSQVSACTLLQHL